jgi:hypothetical protein
VSKLQQQQEATIRQDKLNRQTPFDPKKQLYPVGFDSKGQPIRERNPRWHTPDGFYIGRYVQR